MFNCICHIKLMNSSLTLAFWASCSSCILCALALWSIFSKAFTFPSTDFTAGSWTLSSGASSSGGWLLGGGGLAALVKEGFSATGGGWVFPPWESWLLGWSLLAGLWLLEWESYCCLGTSSLTFAWIRKYSNTVNINSEYLMKGLCGHGKACAFCALHAIHFYSWNVYLQIQNFSPIQWHT